MLGIGSRFVDQIHDWSAGGGSGDGGQGNKTPANNSGILDLSQETGEHAWNGSGKIGNFEATGRIVSNAPETIAVDETGSDLQRRGL